MELAQDLSEYNLDDHLTPLELNTAQFIRERLKALTGVEDGSRLVKELRIPYLPMCVPNIPWREMHGEALRWREHFVEHRGNESHGWRSLCLHGIHATATRAPADYGYATEKEVPYVWTEVAKESPVTRNWLQQLVDDKWFAELYRVRFMWLDPGGHILFHQDRPDGENSLGPLNVALNMPQTCYWLFKQWGRVPFTSGSAFAVDVAYQHGVWNFSQEPRIHLIVHGRYGRGYYNAIASGSKNL